MRTRALSGMLAVGILLGTGAVMHPRAFGQEEITRKVKTKPAPAYPPLARRMNLSGVVRIQITVATNGTVKNMKVVGGHPVLAGSALEAIKKWRYEPAKDETSGIVEFRFDPSE